MGRTATIIAVSYGVIAVLSVALALAVWRSTRARRSVDADLLARREKAWFAVSVVILVSILFATIFFTPYGQGAGAGKQVVRVTGFQFGWSIEPQTLTVNVPVEFRLTALNVSHAFAVYNAEDELLFQVQVVPERTQTAFYTFKEPGTYEVLCFEFCGLFHDRMRATFEVRSA